MSAREAVARAIQLEAPGRCPTHMAQHLADAVLAALRPIIAAEIRAWADGCLTSWDAETGEKAYGYRIAQGALRLDADAIAARITTTGEQQ